MDGEMDTEPAPGDMPPMDNKEFGNRLRRVLQFGKLGEALEKDIAAEEKA